jgi:hypothetical protein
MWDIRKPFRPIHDYTNNMGSGASSSSDYIDYNCLSFSHDGTACTLPDRPMERTE